MAVQANQISVSGTVASVLAAAGAGDRSGVDYRITNRGPGTAFVGPATVAGTTGHSLIANDYLVGHLNGGEAIYGIVAAGTAVCHVLQTSD